jgi:pimeloyl-ACP methyl ester carboxylesterase
MVSSPAQTGYAPVNGLDLYYEIHGSGKPLVLLHGGFGLGTMFGDVLTALAATQQVIAVDLQGHGHTADIDRPLRLETMADDIAALIEYLDLGSTNLMGYSMGAGVALRTAIQHPAKVEKLVVVSIPFKRDGWYPEVRAGMEQINAAAAPFMRESPMYQAYQAVAPRPDDFAVLLDKMGDSVKQPYDWSNEVAVLPMPVLLVFGDADGVPTSHIAEFYGLLGGGKRDAGWDGANMPKSQLAILPGTTHYNVFMSPLLASVVTPFLDAPAPASNQ